MILCGDKKDVDGGGIGAGGGYSPGRTSDDKRKGWVGSRNKYVTIIEGA